jgi:hypothetical protein
MESQPSPSYASVPEVIEPPLLPASLSDIPTDGGSQPPDELTAEQKRAIIIVIIVVILLLVLMGLSVVYLLQPTTDTAKVRDVFIIFMALQSMLTGLTLVVLMIQMARLANLLQNEIKPILDSTNETISNLRGTTNFLSANLVEPVIKVNEYVAGLNTLFELLGLTRRTKK